MVGCWSSCWRALQEEIEKASITNRNEIMGKICDLAARRDKRWRPKLMLSIIEGGRSRRKDCRGGGGLRENRESTGRGIPALISLHGFKDAQILAVAAAGMRKRVAAALIGKKK